MSGIHIYTSNTCSVYFKATCIQKVAFVASRKGNKKKQELCPVSIFAHTVCTQNKNTIENLHEQEQILPTERYSHKHNKLELTTTNTYLALIPDLHANTEPALQSH